MIDSQAMLDDEQYASEYDQEQEFTESESGQAFTDTFKRNYAQTERNLKKVISKVKMESPQSNKTVTNNETSADDMGFYEDPNQMRH